MPTKYYLISSYLQDKGGLNLVIDFKGGSAIYSPASGTLLVTNQPTGADSQLWTIVPYGSSGYSFLRSKVKDRKGKHLVIDIKGGITTPGTPLDGYPKKSTGYGNQLWKFVAEVLVPGYSFIESKKKNPKGTLSTLRGPATSSVQSSTPTPRSQQVTITALATRPSVVEAVTKLDFPKSSVPTNGQLLVIERSNRI